MGKVVKSIFGGGSKPKAPDPAPVKETKDASSTAKKSRSALLATKGGIKGEELNPNEVQKKNKTLLGN